MSLQLRIKNTKKHKNALIEDTMVRAVVTISDTIEVPQARWWRFCFPDSNNLSIRCQVSTNESDHEHGRPLFSNQYINSTTTQVVGVYWANKSCPIYRLDGMRSSE